MDMAHSQGRAWHSAAVASIDELARKGRNFSVLCALGRSEPMNMSQFTKASHLVPDRAKVLREELEEHGLIAVKVVRSQGPADILEIKLTPMGRDVARLIVAADDVLRAGDGAGSANERARRRRD